MDDTNGGVRIRRARKSDATAIAFLSGQLGYPASAREIAGRLAGIRPPSQNAVFVAVRGAKVIGWTHVSAVPLLEMPLKAEVNGLVVDEDERSAGAGAKLLKAAEAWARARRCVNMSVRSNIIRERAHGFYERHGYEHFKTQKAFRKPLRRS
jgi:GNAT superfamily N-acetyltransferase